MILPDDKKIYFKKSIFGNIKLMIQDEKPGSYPGDWDYYWRNATEQESQEIIQMLEQLTQDSIKLNKIKETHPELII